MSLWVTINGLCCSVKMYSAYNLSFTFGKKAATLINMAMLAKMSAIKRPI